MNKALKIQNILSEIRKLDQDARLYVLERLAQLVRQQNNEKTVVSHLTELNNLGAEIWKDIDIDHYIRQERQWD